MDLEIISPLDFNATEITVAPRSRRGRELLGVGPAVHSVNMPKSRGLALLDEAHAQGLKVAG